LEKFDKVLATRIEKPIGSGSSKALWQYVKHQQIKKIFSRNCSGPIFVAFGVDITERDSTVFTVEDIFFLDDTF
jgi:hypothetical protein